MKAYIRSYFDGDFEKFKRRFKRISSFYDIARKYNIQTTVVAQCYSKEVKDIVKKEYPEVTLDEQPALNEAGATNYILKNYLYNTNEDYIMSLDDDIIVLDYKGLFGAIIEAIESKNNNIKGHFAVDVNYMGWAFKECDIFKNIQNNLLKEIPVFHMAPFRKTAFFIFWNTKKQLNKEIYTINKTDDGVFVFDDWWFAHASIMEGVRVNKIPHIRVSAANGWGAGVKKSDTVISEDYRTQEICKKNGPTNENARKELQKIYGKDVKKTVRENKLPTEYLKLKTPVKINVEYAGKGALDEFF